MWEHQVGLSSIKLSIRGYNMFSASDLRKGLKIEMDNEPYEIVDFQLV